MFVASIFTKCYISKAHSNTNELVNFDDHLTEGAVACALSHLAALQKVANDSSADWGLILEDDVSLVVPDVDRSISTILEQLPAHWSAVFLGYHNKYGCPHRRSANSSFRRFDDWAEEEPGMTEVEPVFEIHDHNWGLYAWMVKKEAARLLVEELFPISSQVDYAISRFLITQCGGVFSVHPDRLLFFSPTSQEGQDSDIQTMRAEEAVVEEFGSWEAYLEAQRPSSYGEYDAEVPVSEGMGAMSSKSVGADSAADSASPPSAQHFMISTAAAKLSEAFSGDDKKKKEKNKKKKSRKSSSTSPSEESGEAPEVDVAAAVGLPSKEFARSSKQSCLEDLSVRQLACALSGVYAFMLPSDMMEIGGSYESWQRLFVYREG
ncbi:unnamed protein product [Symbiodinium sp. CCMP2592]|nr:unnamed protein product [Symbiodinium sp. CCMP2592]